MELTAESFVEALWRFESEAERKKIRRRCQDSDIIGVRMKHVFDTAAEYTDAPLDEVDRLFDSPYYEARIGAVSILDFKARRRRATEVERRALYELYMRCHDRIDNWDLVDRAAPRVIGGYLLDKPRDPLYELARSSDRWERRTAVTATFWLVRNGEVDDCLRISAMLLQDEEPLIHTSIGTGLREVGKVDLDRLVEFVHEHADRIPGVTFRYATERLPESLRDELRSSVTRPGKNRPKRLTNRPRWCHRGYCTRCSTG